MRDVAFKILRGVKANIPTLNVGELYLATDENQVYIGTGLGNTRLNLSTYDVSGVRQFPHIVTGSVTTVSKNTPVVVTFSGAAVFTSASSYIVLIQSNAGHVTITQTSGSSMSIVTGSIGDVVNFVCIGT